MRLFIISIFFLCIISMVFGQASEKQTDTGRQGGGKASVIGQTDANRETGHVQHNKDDALTRDPSDTDLDKKQTCILHQRRILNL
uniref:Secreted protein n=1 Tax=Panagrolaimus sp. PS1159 TaxID=55785 RepID=A0AC35FXR2_9BILA